MTRIMRLMLSVCSAGPAPGSHGHAAAVGAQCRARSASSCVVRCSRTRGRCVPYAMHVSQTSSNVGMREERLVIRDLGLVLDELDKVHPPPSTSQQPSARASTATSPALERPSPMPSRRTSSKISTVSPIRAPSRPSAVSEEAQLPPAVSLRPEATHAHPVHSKQSAEVAPTDPEADSSNSAASTDTGPVVPSVSVQPPPPEDEDAPVLVTRSHSMPFRRHQLPFEAATREQQPSHAVPSKDDSYTTALVAPQNPDALARATTPPGNDDPFHMEMEHSPAAPSTHDASPPPAPTPPAIPSPDSLSPSHARAAVRAAQRLRSVGATDRRAIVPAPALTEHRRKKAERSTSDPPPLAVKITPDRSRRDFDSVGIISFVQVGTGVFAYTVFRCVAYRQMVC